MAIALRYRLATIRTRGADNGGALIWVLLVSMVIAVTVTGAVATIGNTLIPARASQDRQTAYQAAMFGLQDAAAFLNSSSGCDTKKSTCSWAPSTPKSATITNCALQTALPSTTATATNTSTPLGTARSNILAGSGESFVWYLAGAVDTDPSDSSSKLVRVVSAGCVGSNTVTLQANLRASVTDTKTTTATTTTTPSATPTPSNSSTSSSATPSPTPSSTTATVTNPGYAFYAMVDTLGSSQVASMYPKRSIYVDCNNVNNAVNNAQGAFVTGSCSSPLSWNGATEPNTQVCNRLWYNSAANATATGTTNNNGRSVVQGSTTTEFSETGTTTRTGSCQVPLTRGMTFNGKVFEVDAPLVSNGAPSGTGPAFNSVFNTAWSTSSTPAGATAKMYRSDSSVGGTVTTNAPTTATDPYNLPKSSFSPAVPANACIFFGPTRVYLNGDGTATVTSPLTPYVTTGRSTDSSCYSNVVGTGRYTVNYSTSGGKTIYVKAVSGSWRKTGQISPISASTANPLPSNAAAANSVFWVEGAVSGTGVPSADQQNTASSTDNCSGSNSYAPNDATPNKPCAWSEVHQNSNGSLDAPGWTVHTTNMGCQPGMNRNANDQHNFNCEWNGNQTGGSTTNDTIYSTFRQRMQSRLGQSQCISDVTALVACVNTQLGEGAANQSDHRYLVTPVILSQTADSTTTRQVQNSSNSTVAAPLASDPFFTSSSGGKAVETKNAIVFRVDITRQTLTNGVWGNDVAQFSFTVTMNAWIVNWPASVSYFPNTYDVTQYNTGSAGAYVPSGSTTATASTAANSNGPGDVYVEGKNSGALSILADNDAYITGPITTASGTVSTSIDALGNISVYHPVACSLQAMQQTSMTALQATSVGWCPNDLTGAYVANGTKALESNGTLNAIHPALQYCNMTTGLTSNTGNSNCSSRMTSDNTTGTSESNGIQIDAALISQGGSVSLSNYYRGVPIGTVTVNGGIYERYQGPFVQEWERRTSDSSTSRATSGANLTVNYVDTTAAPYNPVSITTAANGGTTSPSPSPSPTSSTATPTPTPTPTPVVSTSTSVTNYYRWQVTSVSTGGV